MHKSKKDLHIIFSLILESATLLAPFETVKEPLPISDVYGEWWSTAKDVETNSIVISNGWEFVGWNFETSDGRWGVTGFPDDALSEDYIGFGLDFDPIEHAGLQFKGTTAAGKDFFANIPVGATSLKVVFGESVYRLGLTCDGTGTGYNHETEVDNDGNPVWVSTPYQIKINESYVIKKASGETGIKNITANTGPVDVYTILGVKVRSNVEPENALIGLEKGIYIVGGKKVSVTK